MKTFQTYCVTIVQTWIFCNKRTIYIAEMSKVALLLFDGLSWQVRTKIFWSNSSGISQGDHLKMMWSCYLYSTFFPLFDCMYVNHICVNFDRNMMPSIGVHGRAMLSSGNRIVLCTQAKRWKGLTFRIVHEIFFDCCVNDNEIIQQNSKRLSSSFNLNPICLSFHCVNY